MLNWIQHPVILHGGRVKLVPLDKKHFEPLLQIGANPKIWEFYSVNGSDRGVLLQHLENAIIKREAGEYYPFTIIDGAQDKIIGSTFLYNFSEQHRKLEIGWTWYDPAYWRTGYNRECKLLLLTYCFEVLKTIRVQLVTADNNQRSREAILGIGASFEGILRNERIRWNGEYRNTAVYSIIDAEWEQVKQKLARKVPTAG